MTANLQQLEEEMIELKEQVRGGGLSLIVKFKLILL